MNILFTVCGRAGSKGAKGKNVRNFLDIPLVYYTLSTIDLYKKKHGDCFDRADIALSTDSLELIHLCEKVNQDIFVVNRAADLAGDFVGKLDVIKDCAKRAEQEKKVDYDMVVDLDITSPLRTQEDLHHVIEKKKERNSHLVFTVTGARRNPYFNMVSNQNGSYLPVIKSDYVSRQQAPEVYDMNASIYAYSKEYIHSNIQTKDRISDIVFMKDTAVLDIDCEEDFELMQIIAAYLYKKDEAYAEIQKNIANIIKG